MIINRAFNIRVINEESECGKIIMSKDLEKLLYFFYEISKIPRMSGKENNIADYLENFAKSRNLEYYRDINNNVLIKKNSNTNNDDTIILQAHTDMVCVKTIESAHDFEKDGINIVQDGDIIKALDTSLGADDGIGMAYMLFLLDSKYINHPNIECLFTTEEETTFSGVMKFDYTKLKGKELINLDGCKDDTIIIGSDADICMEYHINSPFITNNLPSYNIKIFNIKGGNSGANIKKNQINAITLIGNLLKHLSLEGDIYINSINGGTSEINIANECECIINTSIENINEKINKFKSGINLYDEKPNIDIIKVENKSTFTLEDSTNIIKQILDLKQNILTENESNIISSGNLGLISTDGNSLKIKSIIRSIDDNELKKFTEQNNQTAMSNGFSINKVYEDNRWYPSEKSKLRDKYIKIYKETNLEEPKFEISHGGIECSVFSKKILDIDMISIGTIIESSHTTEERIYISSCEKILKTLINFLESYI